MVSPQQHSFVLGFKDLVEDGPVLGIDSGFNSRQRDNASVPALPVLAENSLSEESVRVDRGNERANEQIPQNEPQIPTTPYQQNVDSVEHVQQIRYINPNLGFGNKHHGIKYGTSEDLLRFVCDIGSAKTDSGMFLTEFSNKLQFSPNFIVRQNIDYRILQPFVAGTDMYLCSGREGNLFVTKLVPLVSNSCGSQLKYKQQVEIVVSYQHIIRGLCKVYGLVKRNIQGQDYGEIFMEFFPNGTLNDNRKAIQSADVKVRSTLICSIAGNIKELHDEDIVHGDLKPQNLVLKTMTETALIDFESVKHVSYPHNKKSTLLYMPPWYNDLFASRDFQILKSMDMWALGILVTSLVFSTWVWETEYKSASRCNSCGTSRGSCNKCTAKFLKQISSAPHKVFPYLPEVSGLESPEEKRLACVVYGLLTPFGPDNQLTASEVLDALDERNVIVPLVKEVKMQSFNMGALVVKKGTRVKSLMNHPRFLRILHQEDSHMEPLHPEFLDGFWCSQASGTKHRNIDINMELLESGMIYIHPPQGILNEEHN